MEQLETIPQRVAQAPHRESKLDRGTYPSRYLLLNVETPEAGLVELFDHLVGLPTARDGTCGCSRSEKRQADGRWECRSV